jgi:hypothetical protein
VVVIFARLENWWRSFDKVGRAFMIHSNPVFGAQEQKLLAEAKREREERNQVSDG